MYRPPAASRQRWRGHAKWHPDVTTGVGAPGTAVYDIAYGDGDIESGVAAASCVAARREARAWGVEVPMGREMGWGGSTRSLVACGHFFRSRRLKPTSTLRCPPPPPPPHSARPVVSRTLVSRVSLPRQHPSARCLRGGCGPLAQRLRCSAARPCPPARVSRRARSARTRPGSSTCTSSRTPTVRALGTRRARLRRDALAPARKRGSARTAARSAPLLRTCPLQTTLAG